MFPGLEVSFIVLRGTRIRIVRTAKIHSYTAGLLPPGISKAVLAEVRKRSAGI